MSTARFPPSPTRPILNEGPFRALLLENIHPSAEALLAAEGFQVERTSSALKPAELAERLKGVHLLGIRSKTTVPAESLVHADELLAIGAFCIGTNQVDLTSANTHGIPVFNAPFSNTRSVAEMVIAEIIALTRQLFDRSREVHTGQWRKVATGSHEVRGKTLGIIGYGHIGSQLGVLAESLGLRVLYFDVMTKLPLGNSRAVGSLDELLAESDFVTLHVPALTSTHMMMGSEQLAKMKKGACLINASRGTVVDISALAAALRSKHLGGAAVDVYPEEPEGNSDGFVTELQNLPNVILTPHIGGSTEEAQASIGREVAVSLSKFFRTGATTGSVNFPMVEAPLIPGTHRILNVHRNIPGVLRDINRIVSDLNANIHAQVLSTDANIGYLVMDLDQDVSRPVCDAIAGLTTDIKTRIVS
ncbi:phosphoglycerate dehydrogenase [Myxococcus sp. CA056]|uniref:phosphoglycerate dehydrogenase n=1 Tax=unclassified Myxococcus TaxID=2648731 RepID=UPI00157B251C|nr:MULTISPECIES: phosphoglycerate dehydrogenase [unclassified Myxococcus]NTX11845.1 phosphoglycerate dehydrogenase [Myxococcus sp. CA056]NTX34053.1 phosphoglycerate dehydrogenase [Myxococcus sp. CA033]NTX56499.1 phosphoglycerate dehydrogenase [Myxococcus sp. CA039A]